MGARPQLLIIDDEPKILEPQELRMTVAPAVDKYSLVQENGRLARELADTR